MSRVDVFVFPKKCAACGSKLNHVQKMSASWYECRNEACVVGLLDKDAEAQAQEESTAFLNRLRDRRDAERRRLEKS